MKYIARAIRGWNAMWRSRSCLNSCALDHDRLQRFEVEAKAAAALNHPNILAVYQMGTYAGVPYLVSELLDGKTLTESVRRGPLPLRTALNYGSPDCARHGCRA